VPLVDINGGVLVPLVDINGGVLVPLVDINGGVLVPLVDINGGVLVPLVDINGGVLVPLVAALAIPETNENVVITMAIINCFFILLLRLVNKCGFGSTFLLITQ